MPGLDRWQTWAAKKATTNRQPKVAQLGRLEILARAARRWLPQRTACHPAAAEPKGGKKAGDRRLAPWYQRRLVGQTSKTPAAASQTCAFCPEMEASSSGASISSSSGVDSIVALVVRLRPCPPGCHAPAARFITAPSASGRWMMTRSPDILSRMLKAQGADAELCMTSSEAKTRLDEAEFARKRVHLVAPYFPQPPRISPYLSAARRSRPLLLHRAGSHRPGARGQATGLSVLHYIMRRRPPPPAARRPPPRRRRRRHTFPGMLAAQCQSGRPGCGRWSSRRRSSPSASSSSARGGRPLFLDEARHGRRREGQQGVRELLAVPPVGRAAGRLARPLAASPAAAAFGAWEQFSSLCQSTRVCGSTTIVSPPRGCWGRSAPPHSVVPCRAHGLRTFVCLSVLS